MTQDEILKIANDMAFMGSIWIEDDSDEFKDMIKFAELVAAKEREEFMGRLVKNPSIVRQIIDAVLLASHPGGLKKRKAT